MINRRLMKLRWQSLDRWEKALVVAGLPLVVPLMLGAFLCILPFAAIAYAGSFIAGGDDNY